VKFSGVTSDKLTRTHCHSTSSVETADGSNQRHRPQGSSWSALPLRAKFILIPGLQVQKNENSMLCVRRWLQLQEYETEHQRRAAASEELTRSPAGLSWQCTALYCRTPTAEVALLQ
jgi:hypothetical protein